MRQSIPNIQSILATAGAVAFFAPVVATAQQATTPRFEVIRPSPGEIKPDDGPPLLDVKVEASYTAGGETEFKGGKFDDSSAFNLNISASTFVPLSDTSQEWMLPFDLQSQNIYLDSFAGVPLPEDIHTLEFSTGLAYKPNDEWMYMLRLSPTLYKLDEIGSNDIGFSGGIVVEWERSPSVKWVFGLLAQTDNDLPVIPLIGVEWKINEEWELDLMLLSPRVVYTFNDQWKFHVGAGLNFGTTFRTDDTLGTSIGLPEYDDEIGSYSDLRLGAGVQYQFNKSWSIEAEAGYSMNREIDYQDIDEKVEFDDAPYISLGLKYEF